MGHDASAANSNDDVDDDDTVY